MKKFLLKVFFSVLLVFFDMAEAFCQTYTQAVPKPSRSLGTVADNLTQTSDVFKSVLDAVFYAIGLVFVFGAMIRYHEHRKNPSQTPISRVVFLLVAGLVIGLFPLMAAHLSGKLQDSAGI